MGSQMQRRRRRTLTVEALEPRILLSGAANALQTLKSPSLLSDAPALAGSGSPQAMAPWDICEAYGISSISEGGVVGNGKGQTIAIIAAYDDPYLVNSNSAHFATSDLYQFDQYFGLPDPPSFRKLNENGGTSYPAKPPPQSDFPTEDSMDVEWAHAIAPEANIILIEANDSSWASFATAVNTARDLPGVSVVSMSLGFPESSNPQDALFATPGGHNGVTFVAASGDDGSPGVYPAYSPNVVAVGGTTLAVDDAGNWQSETAWSGSGGGPSAFESEPSYQKGVQHSGQREIPDVAFDADPNSGVYVYDSYDYQFNNAPSPWAIVYGTSVGTPCWAGLIAITDQLRASRGLGSLDGPSQTLPALYALPASDFHDITSGGNNGYSAGPGYDMVTGLGSPIANKLAPDLANYAVRPSALVFTSEPANGVAGATLAAVQVTIEYPHGIIDTNDNSSVTIAIATGPSGKINGTLTAPTVNGVATFSDLSVS